MGREIFELGKFEKFFFHLGGPFTGLLTQKTGRFKNLENLHFRAHP